jgi:5-methylcytosine-specific restriction endonuclease McrA
MSTAWRNKPNMGAWRRTRRMVLDRDGWVCQHCGIQMHEGTDKNQDSAPQVHHTRGVEHGDDPRYLVACCRSCNLSLGSPRGQDPRPRPRTQW